MSNDNEEGNMGSTVWQSQSLEAPRISLEYVRHQVEKLNSNFRWNIRSGYVNATLICAALFAVVVFRHPPVQPPESFMQVMRLGFVLALLGAVYVIFQIRQRGKVVTAQKDEKVVQSLDAYRTELQRRRDFYLGAWCWSLLPFVPSMVVWLVGGMLYDQRPNKLRRYGLTAAFWVVMTLFGLWRQRRASQKYQRELDALATLDKK